jgi:nucleolar protein 6
MGKSDKKRKLQDVVGDSTDAPPATTKKSKLEGGKAKSAKKETEAIINDEPDVSASPVKEKKEKKEKKTEDKADKSEKKDKKKSKKEKKQSEPEPEAEEAAEAQPAAETNGEASTPKSKKDKKKAKKVRGDKASKTGDQETGATSAFPTPQDKDEQQQQDDDGKRHKFIVFIGNLPFTATTEHVTAHFASLHPTSVRLLSHRDDPTRSRGIAFVEFGRFDHMKTCLEKFHHSDFSDGISEPRKINVELT